MCEHTLEPEKELSVIEIQKTIRTGPYMTGVGSSPARSGFGQPIVILIPRIMKAVTKNQGCPTKYCFLKLAKTFSSTVYFKRQYIELESCFCVKIHFFSQGNGKRSKDHITSCSRSACSMAFSTLFLDVS